jgi:transposase
VPLRIVEESGGESTGEPDRAAPAQSRLLEISGALIRVEPGVELTTLSTVLSALRGGW